MSEKPIDGTVAMLYGEVEDTDYLAAEDYLPTLPNTVSYLIRFLSIRINEYFLSFLYTE